MFARQPVGEFWGFKHELRFIAGFRCGNKIGTPDLCSRQVNKTRMQL